MGCLVYPGNNKNNKKHQPPAPSPKKTKPKTKNQKTVNTTTILKTKFEVKGELQRKNLIMCARLFQYLNNPEHQKGPTRHNLKEKRGKITNIRNIVHEQESLLLKKEKSNQKQ